MDFFEPKTTKNQGITASSCTRERGGAIIWIFVMIALFAALNFIVSKGTRTGMSGMSEQQADLAATEILDYARAIKSAVHELQISGCADTEISFENYFLSAFSNPNSPIDNSCHIFHPNGGALSDKFNGGGAHPSNTLSNSVDGYLGFTGSTKVNGLGTPLHELILGIRSSNSNAVANNNKTTICNNINKKLGISTTPTGSGLDLQIPFNGTYGVNNTTIGIVGAIPEFNGTSEGCYFYLDGWIYYKVLIER